MGKRLRSTLPHPTDVVMLKAWMDAGFPHERAFERWRFRTLRQLLNALPAHLPVYRYGTPENRNPTRYLRRRGV